MIGELNRASELCDRIGRSARSANGIGYAVEGIAEYLGADTATFRSLTLEEGRPAVEVVIQFGLPAAVEEAYRTRYLSIDPALRLLRRPMPAPVFAHPKQGGEWQHERAPPATLAHYRDQFARYRREFLLPNRLYHHIGLCLRDPAEHTLLFDFHRPSQMPAFGRLDLARARLIASFLQANVLRASVDGGCVGGNVDRRLSHREIEIAQAVAQGLSNKEIAARFAISVRTVENHVRAIFAKLEVNTRTRLAAKLYRTAGASDAHVGRPEVS